MSTALTHRLDALLSDSGLTLQPTDTRAELAEARREARTLRSMFVGCFDAAVALQRENDALRQQLTELHDERGRIARSLFGWTPSHEAGESA